MTFRHERNRTCTLQTSDPKLHKAIFAKPAKICHVPIVSIYYICPLRAPHLPSAILPSNTPLSLSALREKREMTSSRVLLLAAAITALLFVHGLSAKSGADPDFEEDLSFLEEDEDNVGGHDFPDSDDAFPEYTGDEADDDEGLDHEGFADSDHDGLPAIDETDVVVLKDANFSDFVGKRRHVMVEFYAPWCGHCQALAPEYAAAATALRGEDVALAKVDATEENELAQKYEVQGFPTVLFFVDGVHKDYPGQRTK